MNRSDEVVEIGERIAHALEPGCSHALELIDLIFVCDCIDFDRERHDRDLATGRLIVYEVVEVVDQSAEGLWAVIVELETTVILGCFLLLVSAGDAVLGVEINPL